MNSKIQTLIRVANRSGYCDQTVKIEGTDYDFVHVELSGVKGLPYEQRHSYTLKVTVHRRFEANRVREFRNIEMTGNIICDTDTVCDWVCQACADMGATIA